MSPDIKPITRDNLNEYLKDLAKDFRKLNGTKTPAEIILIGGAAVLAGYGFRDLTYDVDAIIVASSAMKDAIKRREGQKDSMLAKLEEKKQLAERTKQSNDAPVGHDRSGQEPR